MRTKSSLFYVVTVFAAALLVATLNDSDSKAPLSPTGAVAGIPVQWPLIEGTWAGTWTDTVFNVSGAMTFVIWAEGADYAANGTIDVTEIGFPGLGLLSGGGTGLNNGGSLDITFSCANLGNGTFSLIPNKGGVNSAAGTGSGIVTAPMNFGAFTLIGAANDTDIDGSFDFAGGGKGVATMSKSSVPVETETWGNVKATYRGR